MIEIKGDIDKSEFMRVVKKPVTVLAKQMNDEFVVNTMEGKVRGKKGDYLMVGVKGEMYPCDREIFEETYKRKLGFWDFLNIRGEDRDLVLYWMRNRPGANLVINGPAASGKTACLKIICEIIAKKFSIDPSGVNCYTVNGDVVVPLGFSTIVVNTKELENQIPNIMTLARSQIEDLVKEVYA